MRTAITAPDILHALALTFVNPSLQIIVALLGPAALLALQIYFRTRRKAIARDADAAFESDPRLASAWRDLERESIILFETYSRGRSRHQFRVNRKSDWRFDQRRHAAADANRDVDALFARFYEAQHLARRRFAIWKWSVAGARATDTGALAYVTALLILLLTIGNAAFAISGAIALGTLALVWIGYAPLLTPGDRHRIVTADITWETLAHTYEASELHTES